MRARGHWRKAKGALYLTSARAALPGLASSLDIVLPAPGPRALDTGILERDCPDTPLACALEGLDEVTLGGGRRRQGQASGPVDDGDLVSRERGRRTRVSTWITSSRHGRLGGLVFGAASWHQKARDFIRWSRGARDVHLVPGVRGLASVALSLFHGRVADDWKEHYGVDLDLAYGCGGSRERAGPADRRRPVSRGGRGCAPRRSQVPVEP